MNWHQRIGRLLPALIVGVIAAGTVGEAFAQGTGRGCSKNCPRPQRAEFASPGDALLAARNAVATGDTERFEIAAARVGDHPLAQYVDYWRMRMRLAEARVDASADADALAFVDRHSGTLLAELARRDWLLSLGRRQSWDRFDLAHSGWTNREDTAVACFALQARASRGESVAAEARELLLQPRDLGDACNSLHASLAAGGQLSPADLWRRVEVAIEAGSPGATRRAALLAAPSLETRQLDIALNRPAAALAANPPREIAVIALGMLARSDPAAAAERLHEGRLRLRDDDRAFLWSQVAAGGMRRLLPRAHEWTRAAAAARPSDETLAWMTRAALRAQDWPLVRSTIERMSAAAQAETAWTYWLARAIQTDVARPGSQHQARVLLTHIYGRPDFYSQLAGEELGLLTFLPAPAEPPTAEEIAAARANAGLARAIAFYELGLRIEGNREWNFQLRGMTDRQLLAAAEFARGRDLYDRAVHTAERTRREHDYSLRFLAPFGDTLRAAAGTHGVDPSWVYGLIRQESRFRADARSSAGASGLMQLMPATARWVARKIGLRDFEIGRVNELQTNLQLGTFYFRTVLDELDGSPLLASAAYNAGPGRPRSWRGTLAQPVEGAIFAEIIPFNETRGYVKAVLSNASYYAAMFSGRPQSLKALLGSVGPTPGGAPAAQVATAD